MFHKNDCLGAPLTNSMTTIAIQPKAKIPLQIRCISLAIDRQSNSRLWSAMLR
jgi:hypothetical protein